MKNEIWQKLSPQLRNLLIAIEKKAGRPVEDTDDQGIATDVARASKSARNAWDEIGRS